MNHKTFYLGMGLSALAYFMFTVFDTLNKFLSARYPVYEVIAITFLSAGLLQFLWLAVKSRKASNAIFQVSAPRLHLLRGLAQAAGQVCVFTGITHMQLTQFYTITFTIPLWVSLFAVFWFKEKFTLALAATLGFSLWGVLIALKPEIGGIDGWMLLTLLGALLLAISTLCIRKLVWIDPPHTVTLSLMGVVGLCMAVPTAFYFIMPTAQDLLFMFATSVVFLVGQTSQAFACKKMEASYASLAQFLQLIYGAIAGFLVFGDVPLPQVLAGGGLVVLANIGLMLFMRHQHKKIQQVVE